MRRSSLSIVSNIAEWSGRWTDPEHKYFLHIAKGSCMELATQVLLAQEFWYIKDSAVADEIIWLIGEITKMLYAMIKK
jgi:four helix bundle protein